METDWELIIEKAPWPPRDSAGAVVYRDRMWILGGWQMVGTSGYRRLNAVWYSEDGLTWKQVTPKAPWSVRNLSGCVVFDDRIWVMGGFDGTYSLADVWCSPDGCRWDQVKSEAPWGRRGAFGCVIFDDRMWVMGGVDWKSEEHKRDVWYSRDGVHWTLATDSPGWEPRAMFPTLVFHGRMWILGGGIYHDRKVNHNDVWCSTDGVEWQLLTRSAAWEGRRFHESLVFDHAMWILGGVITEATNMNDVWYSFDGEQWQPANRFAPWGVRHEPACLIFREKVWLLGGFSGALAGNRVYNDVWMMETTG